MSWLHALETEYADVAEKCSGISSIDCYFAAHFCLFLPSDIKQIHGRGWFSLLLTLHYAGRDGHSCLLIEDIANTRWFSDDSQQLEAPLEGIQFPSHNIMLECIEHSIKYMPEGCVFFENGRLYTGRQRQFEVDIARLIYARSCHDSDHALSIEQENRLRTIWPTLFKGQTWPANAKNAQEFAVFKALTSNMLIVNGGPGTGKTYTAARLLAALEAAHNATHKKPLRIQLAAPTGKAAQRLTESLHDASAKPAVTLHRLLGLHQYSSEPKYHAQRLLPCDVLLIDEASMIDMALMSRILRATSPSSRIILLGDSNQLPSVEAGNVLQELIPAFTSLKGAVDVVTLTKTHRFGGDLGQFSKTVLNGKYDEAKTLIENNAAIKWVKNPITHDDLSKDALDDFSVIFRSESAESALKIAETVRWLTPLRQGSWGAQTLNDVIEHALSTSFKHVQRNEHYRGRLIMVTQNHYATGLFNGDVGVVWPDSQNQLKAWFYNGQKQLRAYALSRLPAVVSTFAMTVHKSQGSEFTHPRIIMPCTSQLSEQIKRLIDRQLLYTAITRAKSSITLYATPQTLDSAIAKHNARMSGLAQRIVDCN